MEKISSKDVVQMTGIDRFHVYRLAEIGKIPCHHTIGHHKCYFYREEIQRWLLGERVDTEDYEIQTADFGPNAPIIADIYDKLQTMKRKVEKKRKPVGDAAWMMNMADQSGLAGEELTRYLNTLRWAWAWRPMV